MEIFSPLPVTGEVPAERTWSFDVFCFVFVWAWINGWVNNGEAGDLRYQRAHYDVALLTVNVVFHNRRPSGAYLMREC